MKSTVYKALSAQQQKAIQTHITKEKSDLVWGSIKGNKLVHAMAMKLSTGETLSRPSGDTKKACRQAEAYRGGQLQARQPKERVSGQGLQVGHSIYEGEEQARDVLRETLRGAQGWDHSRARRGKEVGTAGAVCG